MDKWSAFVSEELELHDEEKSSVIEQEAILISVVEKLPRNHK